MMLARSGSCGKKIGLCLYLHRGVE
jgi:hypothetical protein